MMKNINRIKKTKKIYKKNKRGGTNVYEERTELVPFKTPDGEIRLIQKSAEAEYAQGKIKPNNFLMDLVPYTGKYNQKKKEGEILLVTENTTTNIKNPPMIKKLPTIIKKKTQKKPIKPVPVPSALAPVQPIKFISQPNPAAPVTAAPVTAAPVTVPVPGPNVPAPGPVTAPATAPATAAPAVTAAPAGVDYDLASPGEYDVGTADTASSYYSKGTANENPYGVAGVPAPVSHGVMANPNYESGIPPAPVPISEKCQDIDWLAYIQSFEKISQVLIDENEIIKRFKNYEKDDSLKDKAKVKKKLKEFGFFKKGTNILKYINSEHTNYIKCLNEYKKSNNSFILNFLNSQKQASYIEIIRKIPKKNKKTDTLTNEEIDKLTTDPEIKNFLKEIIERNKIILSIQKYEYGYKTEEEVNTYIEKESISFLNKFVSNLPIFKVGEDVHYIQYPRKSNTRPLPGTSYRDITIDFIGTIQKITFNEISYHYDIKIKTTPKKNNDTKNEGDEDTINEGDEVIVNSTNAYYYLKPVAITGANTGAITGGSRKKKRITKRKKKHATKKRNTYTFGKSITKHLKKKHF